MALIQIITCEDHREVVLPSLDKIVEEHSRHAPKIEQTVAQA